MMKYGRCFVLYNLCELWYGSTYDLFYLISLLKMTKMS